MRELGQSVRHLFSRAVPQVKLKGEVAGHVRLRVVSQNGNFGRENGPLAQRVRLFRVLHHHCLRHEAVAVHTGARVRERGEFGPEEILHSHTRDSREILACLFVDQPTRDVVVALLKQVQIYERTQGDQDSPGKVRHGLTR